MTQCALERTTVFVEEPEFDSSGPDVEMSETRTGVITLIPHMPANLTNEAIERAQRRALDFVLAHLNAVKPVLWYYAPKTLGFTDHIDAAATVYDCLRAKPSVGRRHQRLLETADVVFTPDTPAAGTAEALWRTMWSQVTGLIGYQQVTCNPALESLSPSAL